jgi:protein SCO1
MKKYIGKAGMLIVILVVPALVFLFLKYSTTNHYNIPYFVPELDEKGEVIVHGKDTVFHKIPEFKLIDQNGNTFTSAQTKGKIYVADFIFTRCKTICPKMTSQLARVQDAFQQNTDVLLVSHSVDPNYDSAEILRGFAKQNEAKDGKWFFLTGDKKAIYNLGINGYKVSVADASAYDKNVSIDETFIHTEKLLLIDKEGYIRGFYDGTDKKEVDRLILEIKVLLDYYKKEKK